MSHPVMDVNWTRSSVICPQGAREIWRPQRKEGREGKWIERGDIKEGEK